MGFFQKIGQFFVDCTPGEIVVLALLVCIPILSIILLIVSLVRHAKNKRHDAKEAVEEETAPVVPTAYGDFGQAIPMPIWIAPTQVQVPTQAPTPAPIPTPIPETQPQPMPPVVSCEPQTVKVTERVVERVKVKVNVTKMNHVDKSLLAATGIFCLGLGVMISRALSGDK